MPPIESYTVIDGTRVNDPAPGDAPPAGSAAAGAETDAPGATPSPQAGGEEPSASPAGTTSAPVGEAGAETDDDEPLRDDSEITAARLERRFKRLTALRRHAERQVEQERQQHNLELAQMRGQLEAHTRLLSGAAPEFPPAPAPPTGPPSAEQYASHEDYVLAAARYGAQQELQARDQQTAEVRQQAAQVQFQRDLMSREEQFKQAHPDFDTVVRGGLAGKVSPVLQQALMLVPDGPAVAYTLARQPELVQRLNSLPPPLVLVELGRLSTGASAATPPAGGPPTANGTTAPGSPPPQLHAPETPLSGAGGGAPTGAFRDDMSAHEYAAWRKRTSQLAAWKER